MGLQRRGLVFEALGGLLVSVQSQAVVFGGGNFQRDVNQCRAHPESTGSVASISFGLFSPVCANELQKHRPYCVDVAA